jgi:hypothetical protein
MTWFARQKTIRGTGTVPNPTDTAHTYIGVDPTEGPATKESTGAVGLINNGRPGIAGGHANQRGFDVESYAGASAMDKTGATNAANDAAFTAMLAAWAASPRGGTCNVGAGVYKVSAAIINFANANPACLKGADRGATVLVPAGATGDMVTFNAGCDGCSIQDIAIYQTAAPNTAGNGINTNGADSIVISNCLFVGQFNDININSSSIKVSIQKTVHSQTNGAAGSVGILVNNGAAGDTYIGPDVVMSNTGATRRRASVEVVASGHFEINQCNLTGSAQGLLVDPGAGVIVADAFVNETLFDSNTVNGVTLNAATATSTIKSIHFENSWFSGTVTGTGGAGFVSTGTAGGIINGITFVNCRALNNQTHGYQHGFGTDFQWIGGRAAGNAAAGSATADGINIAAGVSAWQVIGGKYGGTDGASTGGNQRYGINIVAGASSSYAIIGPDCLGNVTAPLFNGGTGLNQVVTGVMGLLTCPANQGPQAVLPLTTVTRAGLGVSIPAGTMRVGTAIRIKCYVTNTATIQTLTPTLKYGVNNTNADATLVGAALGAGTNVVGGAEIEAEFVLLSATTCMARITVKNNGVTGITNAIMTNFVTTSPVTIATNTANFLGLYLSDSVASIVTPQSVQYEVSSQ